MDENTNDFALTKALQETRNSNKDVSKAFFFKKGKILVSDEYEKDEKGNKIIEAFEEINKKAKIVGGIQAMTIQSTNGRVDITRINDYFLTTVASKEATNETINKLTQVLAPFILNPPKETAELNEHQSIELIPQMNLKQKPTVEIKSKLSSEQSETLESKLTSSEFAEFAVDNTGRLDMITSSHNIVRLDLIIIGHWTELYGVNKIHKIMLKVANTGKTIECKFEEIKESNSELRNVVLIPEMMQRTLQIKKGAKVLIKPLTDNESAEEAPKSTTKEQVERKNYKIEFSHDSPACQLIVEDLSSFSSLMASDMVRFDYSLIERWKEFYDDREVEEVIINDILLGKSVHCKFKFIKDSKFEGKGRIQIPKSIRQELAVKEGSLVIIKPVVKLSAK